MMTQEEFFRSVGGVPESGPVALLGAPLPMWNFGWRRDPDAVAAVLATLPYPRFGAAAQDLEGTGEGKTVLLSDVAKKLLGKHLPAQQQPRGTCVSRGWSRAIDYLECVQIVLGNRPQEFQFCSHAVIYGMGKEVGGDLGPQNRREDGDGLVGAWAARAVTTMGAVRNEDVGDRDAGTDDLAIQYAVKGVPADVKAKALSHLVKTVSLVTTPEQARDAICNGYPVSCCSGQGFTMTRDSDGKCRPQGSWSHCMMWSAYRDDRKQFLVEQSWGQNTPSGPTGDLDIPDNAFWIDWDVAARMLRGEDSFALSNFDGWLAQNLDWLA
jgi:hypothetical protein